MLVGALYYGFIIPPPPVFERQLAMPSCCSTKCDPRRDLRRKLIAELTLFKRETCKPTLDRFPSKAQGPMACDPRYIPSQAAIRSPEADSARGCTYTQMSKRKAFIHRLLRHSYCSAYLSSLQTYRCNVEGLPAATDLKQADGRHPRSTGRGSFPTPKHRESNPLTRIFLQDSTSDSADSSSDAAPVSTTSTDSTGINSLASNPFKKSSQDDNWSKEAHEHRPILAPPRLRAPSEAAPFSSSQPIVGSGVLRVPTTLRPSSGGMLGTSGGGSLFNASSFPSSSSTSASSNKPVFKLKPSMLSGYTTLSPSATPSGTTSGSTTASNSGKDSLEGKSQAANIFGGSTNSKEESPLRASPGGPCESKTSPSRPHLVFSAAASEKEGACGAPESKGPPSTSSEDRTSPPSSSPLPSVAGAAALSVSPSAASSVSRPAFVPLTSANEASSSEDSAKVNGLGANATSPLSTRVGGGFIFGQNLQNRVSGIEEGGTSNLFSSVTATANGEMSAGANENLFTEAATGLTPQGPPSSEEGGAWGGKTLVESSRELSEKEASQKRKYEEVEIITGEENESNVLQMMCKLYWFSLGSWQEKGRGLLRLNDRKINGEIHSRLVIRTQGTFTVMLNAKIWADMSIEKTNDKSVRFTASDADGQLKIFLVMGTPKDIDLLYTSLEYRVAESKLQKPASPSDGLDQERKKLKQDADPPLST